MRSSTARLFVCSFGMFCTMELADFCAQRLIRAPITFQQHTFELNARYRENVIVFTIGAKHNSRRRCYAAVFHTDTKILDDIEIFFHVAKRRCAIPSGKFLLDFTDALAHTLGAEQCRLTDCSRVQPIASTVSFAYYYILTHDSALSWYETYGYRPQDRNFANVMRDRYIFKQTPLRDLLRQYKDALTTDAEATYWNNQSDSQAQQIYDTTLDTIEKTMAIARQVLDPFLRLPVGFVMVGLNDAQLVWVIQLAKVLLPYTQKLTKFYG